MSKAPSTIGFIGDIHVGSFGGLYPVDEIPSKRFKGARYLMDCWGHLVKSWPKLDLLVLMGDLIDGKQQKSSGCGLFTTDVGEQAEMACKVLEPLAAKASRIIRVWGTPYHETHDNILGIIDKAIGVSLVSQVIDLELNGHVLNIAHHPSGGSAIYQGTTVDREALWSQIAAYEKKVPSSRWIVRAHKHNYFFQKTRHRQILITPCWQLPTAYAIKQNYFRFQPDIGGVLMAADGGESSGYSFREQLYDLPLPSVSKWQDIKRKTRGKD